MMIDRIILKQIEKRFTQRMKYAANGEVENTEREKAADSLRTSFVVKTRSISLAEERVAAKREMTAGRMELPLHFKICTPARRH